MKAATNIGNNISAEALADPRPNESNGELMAKTLVNAVLEEQKV